MEAQSICSPSAYQTRSVKELPLVKRATTLFHGELNFLVPLVIVLTGVPIRQPVAVHAQSQAAVATVADFAATPRTDQQTIISDRIHGMLIGSLIGDAAGGPIEFKSNDQLKRWLPDLRSWSSIKFRQALDSGELAAQFKVLPYSGIRDDIAPYGPWETSAPAGTVTDDSRHKMILLNCLREFQQGDGTETSDSNQNTKQERVTKKDLARAYLSYEGRCQDRGREDYAKLSRESFAEYNAVAQWILGERNLKIAHPPQRLWAGIATCSGQMTLPPLAAVFPGDPDGAYRSAYAINFVDVGPAKDINAALVAGLAAAIGSSKMDANKRWDELFGAMRNTDPYDYGSVPFATRPATEWLDFAVKCAERADGSPAELFRILEKEGRAKYYWDAHFTFATSIACLRFADFKPIEAMVVSLAFGHDTDSAAQVIGALTGAIHGTAVFPAIARDQVSKRLKADYGESVLEWTDVLEQLGDRTRYPKPIGYLEDE